MSDDYLTAEEAADQLGVTYHTLMRARRNGFIEAKRRGGWSWFFHRDEVARYGAALRAHREAK